MFMRSGRLGLLACGLAASLASAQDLQVEKYTLPNGMTVILHEDHSRPVATINTWFRVGSKDEPARRSGFAHLFEHLMFMGTERVPNGDFDRLMEAEGGWNNASTGLDRTNYFSVGPSSILPTLLWLDADRLEDLARAMDQSKLDLQRNVVLNELRQNVENEPYGRAELGIQYLMYPPSHPYHFPPIGTEEDLKAATVTDVKDFFATFYNPSNASLVVAGDFDPVVVKPLIADLFGSLPRRPEPMRKPSVPAALDGVKRGVMYDKVQAPQLSFCYHSPAAYADGDAECDLFTSILGDGKSSRLYARLVARDELATAVSAHRELGKLDSLLRIDVIASEGADLDAVERAVDEELERLATDGPTRAELEQQKAKAELTKLSEIEELGARADKLNEYEYYLGEPNSFARDLERYRGASPESVRRWARLVLTPGARGLYRVLPLEPDRGPTARDTRPADFKAAPFSPPRPETFSLSCGVSVMCWEIPGPALETVGVVLAPGGALNRADGSDAGLAALTATMLGEGAGELGSFAFAQAVDAAGASFESAAGREALTLEMTVLARNFERGAALLADAVRRPRLAADDFERMKKIALEELRQSEDDPGEVSGRVAARALYGNRSAMGWPEGGTPETVARFGLSDVQRMYQRLVRPSHATILVAGTLSAGEVRSVLERAFGDWRVEGAAEEFGAPEAASAGPMRVMLVDRPGAVQTMVRFLTPAPAYGSPERVPLELVNTLLGGSFTSRLNQNLRERHGYTYGARSGFEFFRQGGVFTAGAGVTTTVTGAALGEFLAEFARLGDGDIAEVEAVKARRFFRQNLIERFSGTSGVVNTAAGLLVDGAPFESLAADATRAGAVTDQELNALARSFAWEGKGVLVLVGDKGVITEQITSLGLPPIVEVDSYGEAGGGHADGSGAEK